MDQQPGRPIALFYFYAHEDEALGNKLEKHLSLLQRRGLITVWHDRQIVPGAHWSHTIDHHLNESSIILLLISPDFLASDYCYYTVMQRALERHKKGEAHVIPVLLRPVDWQNAPFAHLQCLPRNAVPVTEWDDQDAALREIVKELRQLLEELIDQRGLLALSTPPQSISDSNTDKQRKEEKIARLRAMYLDHSGFLHNRLEHFVGRRLELSEVHRLLKAMLPTGGYITITGQAGQGKSSIIAKLVEDYGQEQGTLEYVAFHFIPLNPGPDHQVSLLRNLMARLILKYDLSDFYVASENRSVLRDSFVRILKEIAAQGKQEIIFIDGLDQLEAEITGSRDLSFLPQGPGNPPPGIVFVLGTRPNDTLIPLKLLTPHYEYSLRNLSREDFEHILQRNNVVLERSMINRFYHQLDENALYLDLVAHELARYGSITAAEVEAIIQQVSDNPENLFALALERLRQPQILWEQVIKPLLGLLLASRESLEREQLKHLINLHAHSSIDGYQLNNGLERLGGLVITDGQQRYVLFHAKFRDFLRQDVTRSTKHYLFDTEDEQFWHHRFLAWCEQSSLTSIWSDTFYTSREQRRCLYTREHYITHLYQAHAWEKLFSILDKGSYGKAKVQHDPSTRSYALDLDLGRKAAGSEQWGIEEGIQHLPFLWRYTLLRCSLASRANSYSLKAFRLMLLLGQESKVLGCTDFMTNPLRKATVLAMIAEYFATHPGREQETEQMFVQTRDLIETIKDSRSKMKALCALEEALAQARKWKEVAQTWQEIQEIIGEVGWKYTQAEVLKPLVLTMITTHHWEEAMELREIVERLTSEAKEGVRAETRPLGAWHDWELWIGWELGKASGQELTWEQAERVVGATIWEKAKPIAELGKALLGEGQAPMRIEEVINSISNQDLRYTVLIEWAKNLGELEKAERVWCEVKQLIEAVPEEGARAKALEELGIALAQANRKEDAMGIWKEVEHMDDTSSFEDIEGRDSRTTPGEGGVLCELGLTLARAGQWEEAEQVINSIMDASIVQTQALRELGTALAQVGQWEEAERIWKKAEHVSTSIIDAGIRMQALRELGLALAQADQWEEAERVSTSITDATVQAWTLSQLGTALAQAGQREKAKRVWKKAEHVSSSIIDVGVETPALRELANALMNANQWNEASNLWNSIKNASLQAWILPELGTTLARAGQWEKAERVSTSITDVGEQMQVLHQLGLALVQAGQWEKAEWVSNSIPNASIQAQVLSQLGTGLAQMDKGEEAERIWQKAEDVINSIEIESGQKQDWRALADTLGTYKKYRLLLHVIQQQWLKAETRDEAIHLLPLAFSLISRNPELGVAFSDSFTWVNNFLHG